MKINKPKEDYSRIIGQIDSLKSNIAQLISVNHNQDTTRTVRKSESSKSKSPLPSKMKTSHTAEKNNKKKEKSQQNKQNKKVEDGESVLSQKLWEKLVSVQKSNQQIKNSHLALEEMLRMEREKRIRLQRELRAATKTKNEVGIQKDLQVNRTESFKIFTPDRQTKSNAPKRKPSKTRDEGQIESFLLGDCDDYAFLSPKRRNTRQLEMMELIHTVSRPGPSEKREEAKVRLLEAVRRLCRKG